MASLETRVSAALSRLESALDESGTGEPAASSTPAPPAGGGSIFSFGSGSPFEAGATERRLSLESPSRARAGPGAIGEPARPEEAGSVASCRPWSRADMAARLGTFSARRWFAKPACVSPVACAQHGWTNPEYDVLACVACGARLRAPRALDGWSEGATAAFARSLDEGHAQLCPWRGNASPAYLLAIVMPAAAGAARARAAGSPAAAEVAPGVAYVLVAGRSRALSALRERYLALAGPGPGAPRWRLPAVDGSFVAGELAGAATHARLVAPGRAPAEADGLALLAAIAAAAQLPDAAALRASASRAAADPFSDAGEGEVEGEGERRRLAVAVSALCLALLGWTWGTPPAALAQPAGAEPMEAARSEHGTLRCAECARTLGAWLFRAAGEPVQAANAAAGGAGAAAATPVGSKRPRADGPAPARCVHPAREHAIGSPWVERLHAGEAGALVPAWAVAAALLLPAAPDARAPAALGAASPQEAVGVAEGASNGGLRGALSSVRSLLGSAFAR